MRCYDFSLLWLEELCGNPTLLTRKKKFFLEELVLPLQKALWKELHYPDSSLPLGAGSSLKIPRENPNWVILYSTLGVWSPAHSKLSMRCAVWLTGSYPQGPQQNRDSSDQPRRAIKGLAGKSCHWPCILEQVLSYLTHVRVSVQQM